MMVTNAGGGYSRWKDIAITRFREDSTCDNYGIFCYLRDVNSGDVWSTAYQPTLKQPLHYEAIFSDGRVEFRRQDHDFDVHTKIVVSPEDDIELRRTTIENHSRSRRTIDVTSYAEVVLAPPCRGQNSSGIQQSFCSGRDHRTAPGNSLHPPAAFRKREKSLDVSLDGRAWDGYRADFLRN